MALVELGEYVAGDRELDEVRNVIFRRGNTMIKTKTKPIENLDELQMPDWSAFDLKNYLPIFHISMTRGCPYNCAFCCGNYIWGEGK